MMAIRIYKKTSNGRRNASVNLNSEVTKLKPEKSLLRPMRATNGRNHHGKITVQGRGGGVKRRYRLIDFRRDKVDVSGTVVGIEYDPNRTCHIALVQYDDGEKAYILAPVGLTDGDRVLASQKPIEPKVGNAMPLRYIPGGLNVHLVELSPGGGGKLCRAAGSYARLTNKEGDLATLTFPSGEIRQVLLDCRATVGQVGNTDHALVRWGKAGRNRYRGRRPKVRGVAMSHHAHPLGGGEGRSKGGRAPSSATGVPSKGGPTRKKGKPSDKRIIRRRRSVRYGILTL
jgi:large subunit ribosomal protein L2